MPIYAYRCSACGHQKDVLQKLSDEPLTDCPACGAASFAKQLTAAGFQLKGSGWYATDFRNGGGSAAAASSPVPATTASGASDAGSSGSDNATASGTPCGGSCACH
jgi:putative FmdB family regulatory protein